MAKKKNKDYRLVYNNAKQIKFLKDLRPFKFLHGSRGFGKSFVIGPQALIYVNNFPGGRGLLTCKDLKQAKAKSLPIIESSWKKLGMEAGVHYSISRTRPDYFDIPISEPKSPDVVWFANGCCIEMVGSKQYDSARGGSYDFVLGDEIAFFPESFYDEVVTPSIRGNVWAFMIKMGDFLALNGLTEEHYLKYFKKRELGDVIPNPLHHSVCLFTSPPKKAAGKWIYKFEELANQYPDEFMWMDADVYDNIDAYGREALSRNKKTMKQRVFDLELGGKRSLEAQIRWYFNFSEDVHTYEPHFEYKTINDKLYRDGEIDGLIDGDRALDLTFDFSGWFNGLLLSQYKNRTEWIFDYMYVKEDSNVDNLVDDFCKKYEDHPNKTCRVFGDRIGHDRTPFGKTLYESIKTRLALNGWACEIKVPRNKKTEEHVVRHKNMNEILAEDNGHLPVIRINKINCKDLIIGLKLVETKPDFKKDKSLENNKDFPQEHAPHGSDMLDYLIHQKHGNKFRGNRRVSGSLEYSF